MIRADNPDLELLLLPGYGENEYVTRKTVAYLGELQIPAVGVLAPFNELPAERPIIEKACIEIPHVIGDHLKDKAGLPHDAPIRTIGHSQGGGGWGLARRERPEGLGDTALIAPVAFNLSETLNQSENVRLARFLGRYFINAMRQPAWQPEVFKASREVLEQFIYDLQTHRFKAKVGFAVMLALQRQAVEHANQGHKVAIICGSSDVIFPADEIEIALTAVLQPNEVSPEIIRISRTTHTPMNGRRGKRQVKAAVDFLQAA